MKSVIAALIGLIIAVVNYTDTMGVYDNPYSNSQLTQVITYSVDSGLLNVNNVYSFHRIRVSDAYVPGDQCAQYVDRIVFIHGDPTIALYRDCQIVSNSVVTFFDAYTLERVDM